MTSDVTVRRLSDAIQALDRTTVEYLHPACGLYCSGGEEACSADGYWEVGEAFASASLILPTKPLSSLMPEPE